MVEVNKWIKVGRPFRDGDLLFILCHSLCKTLNSIPMLPIRPISGFPKKNESPLWPFTVLELLGAYLSWNFGPHP